MVSSKGASPDRSVMFWPTTEVGAVVPLEAGWVDSEGWAVVSPFAGAGEMLDTDDDDGAVVEPPPAGAVEPPPAGAVEPPPPGAVVGPGWVDPLGGELPLPPTDGPRVPLLAGANVDVDAGAWEPGTVVTAGDWVPGTVVGAGAGAGAWVTALVLVGAGLLPSATGGKVTKSEAGDAVSPAAAGAGVRSPSPKSVGVGAFVICDGASGWRVVWVTGVAVPPAAGAVVSAVLWLDGADETVGANVRGRLVLSRPFLLFVLPLPFPFPFEDDGDCPVGAGVIVGVCVSSSLLDLLLVFLLFLLLDESILVELLDTRSSQIMDEALPLPFLDFPPFLLLDKLVDGTSVEFDGPSNPSCSSCAVEHLLDLDPLRLRTEGR